jgi:hypothetical protein
MSRLPASLRPPDPDAALHLENAPEADECTCPDCNSTPTDEENLNVNDRACVYP